MPEYDETQVAAYWNANAPVWIDQVRKGFDVHREAVNNPAIFALIGDVAGKSVLDAGCGEGYNTRQLAALGARVTGIDLSEAMIRQAGDEERDNPRGIDYHLGSFSRMPFFPDGRFDLVVSFMALMDGPDYEGAVREIQRVLKPGGELVFSISHPCFLTPGLGWVKDEDGNRIKVTAGGYFSTEPYVERWKFGASPEAASLPPFSVPRFPRTLSAYVNPLLETGFRLLRLNEPRPSEEACRLHLSLRTERDIVPIFLHVKARKESPATGPLH
jgi:ubiquinone/menaquinone biosynthesis C-methylase UbiE